MVPSLSRFDGTAAVEAPSGSSWSRKMTRRSGRDTTTSVLASNRSRRYRQAHQQLLDTDLELEPYRAGRTTISAAIKWAHHRRRGIKEPGAVGSIALMSELADGIASFPQWVYPFEFPGEAPVPIAPQTANRVLQRQTHFMVPLLKLCGGSLEGRRVLDLGSNAGWWSLAALRAGADFVYGIEGRALLVEQARFVFETLGIERSRYRFEACNVFDVPELESFDVVFCLGLLYHVAKPFELIERIGQHNSDLLVVDTAINRYPGEVLELHHENTTDPKNAVDYSLVLTPSRRALREIVKQCGYESVVLAPRFSNWTGCTDYRNGTRRTFICSKRTPLTGLADEADHSIRDAAAWVTRVVGRTFIKPHIGPPRSR